MDIANRFHTPVTHALERADYLVVSLGITGYLVTHLADVDWLAFWALFWVVDVVGTFPALVAYYRRHRAGASMPTLIPNGYHVAYNVAHSLVTAAAVCLVLSAVAGGPRSYMLALPLHLALDRSLFGNAYKPFGVSFQPDKDARFREFERRFAAGAPDGHDSAAAGGDPTPGADGSTAAGGGVTTSPARRSA